MNHLLMLGRVTGLLGALLCAVGGGARIGGVYWLAGFQVATLLQGGIAALVFGCFCLLAYLTRES